MPDQAPPRRQPWAALLLATPLALLAIVAVEAVQAAATAGGPLLTRLVGSLAAVTPSGLAQLSYSCAVVAAQALLLWVAGRDKPRRSWLLGLVLLSAVQLFLARQVAADDPALARSLTITLGFVLLGLAHAALMVWLARPDALPRLRLILGALLCCASLAAAVVHYQLFVGLYLTLHSAAAMAAFLGIHLGLALVLVGARSRKLPVAGLVGVPCLILAVGLIAPAPDRPQVAATSALVRPFALAKAPDRELLRPEGPPRQQRGKTGPMRPDPDAVARFASQSGLPPLPDGFDLAEHDILMVFIDALRYDRTSLATPDLETTPALRDLVDDGAFSFSRAASPSNGTFPTMASLLSMTYPAFVRLELHDRHWHGRLLPEQRTAPEALAESGFRTFWVGFDFKRVMAIRVHDLWQGFEKRHMELVWPGRDLDADARIARRAIREIRAARAAKKRYFGVVFFSSPHDDYQVHDKRRPSETPLQRYDQEVRYADAQLRRVLAEVGRGGGLDRTVVIVTGDHGEAFGEHRHRYHLSSLYNEQVHVPLAVHVPGLKGEVVDRPTSSLYVLPWLLLRGPEPAREAAETALRDDIGPMLRETKGAVVSELLSRQRQHAALRYADHTLYYDLATDHFKLFDARQDPGEEQDLRQKRVDLAARFTPLVQAYRKARFAGQRYYFTEPPE